jgi:hypothetical protein
MATLDICSLTNDTSVIEDTGQDDARRWIAVPGPGAIVVDYVDGAP